MHSLLSLPEKSTALEVTGPEGEVPKGFVEAADKVADEAAPQIS